MKTDSTLQEVTTALAANAAALHAICAHLTDSGLTIRNTQGVTLAITAREVQYLLQLRAHKLAEEGQRLCAEVVRKLENASVVSSAVTAATEWYVPVGKATDAVTDEGKAPPVYHSPAAEQYTHIVPVHRDTQRIVGMLSTADLTNAGEEL